MQTLEEEIELTKIRLGQAQNRLKVLTNRKLDAERRDRTHRLIERGAILESLVDGLDSMSNKQVKGLLIIALATEESQQYLRSLRVHL